MDINKEENTDKIDKKEWLKSTNDFAILGIKFIYISNAGAIIAILANIHHLNRHPNYSAVQCALTMFTAGIVCSLLTNFLGYMMYRNILIASQNNTRSNDIMWGITAIVLGRVIN